MRMRIKNGANSTREGKYRTVVLVAEGSDMVSPYDEDGANYDKATEILGGNTAEFEGKVRQN